MNKYNVVKFQAPFERMKDYNLNPEVRLYKSIILQAIIEYFFTTADILSITYS